MRGIGCLVILAQKVCEYELIKPIIQPLTYSVNKWTSAVCESYSALKSSNKIDRTFINAVITGYLHAVG